MVAPLSMDLRMRVAGALAEGETVRIVNRHAKLTPYRRPKLTPLMRFAPGPEPTELISGGGGSGPGHARGHGPPGRRRAAGAALAP